MSSLLLKTNEGSEIEFLNMRMIENVGFLFKTR